MIGRHLSRPTRLRLLLWRVSERLDAVGRRGFDPRGRSVELVRLQFRLEDILRAVEDDPAIQHGRDNVRFIPRGWGRAVVKGGP